MKKVLHKLFNNFTGVFAVIIAIITTAILIGTLAYLLYDLLTYSPY
jgi:uncharacterized membrane protein